MVDRAEGPDSGGGGRRGGAEGVAGKVVGELRTATRLLAASRGSGGALVGKQRGGDAGIELGGRGPDPRMRDSPFIEGGRGEGRWEREEASGRRPSLH